MQSRSLLHGMVLLCLGHNRIAVKPSRNFEREYILLTHKVNISSLQRYVFASLNDIQLYQFPDPRSIRIALLPSSQAQLPCAGAC